jgi:antitoxin component YwqK of YwqJK toxin-antitoxin module
MKTELNYKMNVLNGPFTTYYKNGKKEESGFYKDGNYEGERLMYRENGKLRSKAKYENGVQVEGEVF